MLPINLILRQYDLNLNWIGIFRRLFTYFLLPIGVFNYSLIFKIRFFMFIEVDIELIQLIVFFVILVTNFTLLDPILLVKMFFHSFFEISLYLLINLQFKKLISITTKLFNFIYNLKINWYFHSFFLEFKYFFLTNYFL